MVRTIGNPMSWSGAALAGAGRIAGQLTKGLRSQATETPEIRKIGMRDIGRALTRGADDFTALRTDVMFLVLVYPVVGLVLAAVAFQRELLPLIVPLVAGFTLLGPLAAVGLYEMSRRREAGEVTDWRVVLDVLRSDVVGPVVALGLYLVTLFSLWMVSAVLIFEWTLGPGPAVSVAAFANDVVFTAAGRVMIVSSAAVGLVFAGLALVVSLISFPMIIDRRAGLPVAVATSLRVARKNPVTVGVWGLIVAVLMGLGSLPALLGLVVVLPILGHATWHLYRAAIPRETTQG